MRSHLGLAGWMMLQFQRCVLAVHRQLLQVFTFGCPYPANRAWCNEFDAAIPDCWHVSLWPASLRTLAGCAQKLTRSLSCTAGDP